MQNFGSKHSDTFVEQIVRRKKGGSDFLIIFLLILAFVLVMAVATYFIQFTFYFLPLILVFGIWGLWRLITKRNIEFEYICTNGMLDIDAIYNKRSRKRQISMTAQNMEIVAPISDSEFDHYSRLGEYKKHDYTSNTGDDGVWFFTGTYKENKVLITFEPEERIIKDLKRFNPRDVKYNAIQG